MQRARRKFNLYTRIGYLRTLKGWTQEKLAEVSGMSRSAIQYCEQKGAIPRSSNMDKLAKAFNCAVEDLYTTDLGIADGQPIVAA